ncbi:hypothetical protein FGIG_06785 [Fasciola gigantica]|uniref:Uncharacterized protein n=1 Tax=Fasciola gigantica TaxID=46835 RepID=A0A504Z6G4_FASGI|nr:hypothetical protein FGIG_06785 [Fasciola gigantica]
MLDTNSSTRLLPLMLRLFSQFAPCTSCLLSDLNRGASSTTARSSSKSGDNARGSHKLSSDDHGPPTDITLLDKVDRVRPVDLGTPVLPGDSFLRALCLDTGFPEIVRMDSSYRCSNCLNPSFSAQECLTQMLAKLHEEMALLSGETQNTKADTAVNEDDDESDWIVTDRTGKRRPMARKTELDGGASPVSRLFSGIW